MKKRETWTGQRLAWQPDYERIIELLPIGIVRSDSDGQVLSANALARELLGEQVVGTSAADLYAQGSEPLSLTAQSVREALEQSSNGQLINVTVPIRLADQTSREMLCCFGLDTQSNTVAGVIVPGVAELHQALAKIAESLTRSYKLERILSVITSECRRLCGADRAYVKLHDEERAVLVFSALSSRKRHERFPEPFSDTKRGMTGYVFRSRQLYRTGDVSKEPTERYYTMFPDTVSKVVAPLLYQGPDGQKKCYGVIAIDGQTRNQFGVDTDEIITVLARHASIAIGQIRLFYDVQASYQQLLSEIRLSSDAIGAGHLLHTGKNLIRGVIDEIEEIEREFGDTPMYRRKAKELERRRDGLSALRDLMQQLSEQLGKTSREGKERHLVEDLSTIAHRVMNIIPLGDAPVDLEWEAGNRSYPVYGAPTRLLLLIYHLVTNAVTAIKRSASPGKIVIKISNTPGNPRYRRLQVEDNGPGLPKVILDFVRKGTEFSTVPGGSGLGLLTVRETVKDLRGNLTVDSKFGKYTRFTIDLPGPVVEEEDD